jgi:hypothetical protein
MNQYLHLLANNGAGLPNDIWVPPTDRIPPQQADQWSAGISQGIPQHGLEWSLEGYYKQMSGLIDYRQGIDFASSISTDWQQLVEINGEGVAYGTEAMIRKTRGKLTGWLGYTLSWNQRQFAGINAGIAYPGSFDRRHDISATASYQLNDFWQLAGNWVFQSGRPVTLPSAVYQLPGSEGLNGRNYVLVYQGRNQSRMPAYHRLDLSATWFPDGKDKAKSWSFGVYNAYNRQNPFYLDVQSRFGMDAMGNRRVLDFSLTQQSLFPFLPWISHQWEF